MYHTKVLKITNLPQDFTEAQLIAYAKQFGCPTVRVYLPRNHETLRARGYAFLRVSKEAAEPLAETLNNKILFQRVVKCSLMKNPKPNTFRKKSFAPFSKSLNEVNKQRKHAEKRSLNEKAKESSEARRSSRLSKKLAKVKDYQFTMTN